MMGRLRIVVYIVFCLMVAAPLVACANPPQKNNNAAVTNAAQSNTSTPADGMPPLLREINAGNEEGAKKLIEDGANVNATNESGVTPLMNAAGMGKKELVQL